MDCCMMNNDVWCLTGIKRWNTSCLDNLQFFVNRLQDKCYQMHSEETQENSVIVTCCLVSTRYQFSDKICGIKLSCSTMTVHQFIDLIWQLSYFSYYVTKCHCSEKTMTPTEGSHLQISHHPASASYHYFDTWRTTTITTVLRPLYRSTCISRHLQLRTGGLCWRKVLLPACPCSRKPVLSD